MYSNKLKNVIKNNKITKREIAKIIGVSESCYNHYESENDIIPLKHLITICEYLNISLDYIFDFNSIVQYENTKAFSKNIKSGQRLKEFRKDNKITQSELAKFLNTVQPVIVNYENGKHLISTAFIYTICKNYKISADYLLGKIDNPKYLKNSIN